MSPMHEICREVICTSIKFSKRANEVLVKNLEQYEDSFHAFMALKYSSRHTQLTKKQRLTLLKVVLLDEKHTCYLLNNMEYICRARKYELDYIADNAKQEVLINNFYDDVNGVAKILANKNEKMLSIYTLVQMGKTNV